MEEPVLDKIAGGVWSPVFTLPRNEKKVYAALLADGVPAYLPMMRHINVQPIVSKGKNYCYKRVLQVPMFRNYLFANITPEVRFSLNGSRSVIRVLKVEPDQEDTLIGELRMIRELERFAENEEIDVTNGIRAGNRIFFTDGVFAGWEGVVQSVEPEGMAYINISSIDASVRVKYPAAWCRLIPDGV